MKLRILILTSILLIFFTINGQTLEQAKKALRKVVNLDQIDMLKKKYPNWSIATDKTLQSDSLSYPDIVNAAIGDVVLKQFNSKAPKFVLKVLSIEDEELCKVKYIFLNDSKWTKTEIDSIRSLIIKRYTNGESFESLVKEFTMDNNPTGDLNWFYKGMMVDEFDKAVRTRTKGEIFAVDVPNKNWYYVVLKTHDNKTEKAINSIRIKYSN